MPFGCQACTFFFERERGEYKLTENELQWWIGERERLMNMKVLEETERDDFVSPAFLVPKGKSSFRMVIDLRRLNGYTRALPFKMETLQFVATTALPDDQMIIVDIKDGYYCCVLKPARY